MRTRVRGRVQQVGFRVFVLREADALGLRGTVANCADGSVECVVEGRRSSVEAMIARLRQGPPFARVRAVDVSEEPAVGRLEPMRIRA